MVYFYINVGIKHFTDPYWFLDIIPPYLEFIGMELVYISGLFEILRLPLIGTFFLSWLSKIRK